MNKVILMGRLTKAPEVKYTQGNEPIAIARYNLAVNRKYKRENEPEADFVPCVAFGKAGEFAEKHLDKGKLITIVGRIQIRSWDDEKGEKHWATEVVVEEQNFAESKSAEDERLARTGQGEGINNAPEPPAPAYGNYIPEQPPAYYPQQSQGYYGAQQPPMAPGYGNQALPPAGAGYGIQAPPPAPPAYNAPPAGTINNYGIPTAPTYTEYSQIPQNLNQPQGLPPVPGQPIGGIAPQAPFASPKDFKVA